MNETNAIILIGLAFLVFAMSLVNLRTRLQIQKARERGLWPQLGEIPTDADIQRLARAGEKLLAIKLCRQLRGLSLAEAKAVVEKMLQEPQDPTKPVA